MSGGNMRRKPSNIQVSKLKEWIEDHYLQLAIFNGSLILLALLRSAGYFEPYFAITINSIFVFSILSSVFLFGMSHRGAAILAVTFWLLAAIFRILNIEVWAERAALYSYEVLVVSVLITIYRFLASPLRRLIKK